MARRLGAVTIAAVVAVVATSCYQDFDFTADHKADHVYVDSNGDWWDATTGQRVLDAERGDLPVPEDWDGDHLWDRAVVKANGDWVTGSSAGTIHFPAPAQLPAFVPDTNRRFFILPVPGDYDGDGSADPAWYRDSDGTWFIEGMAPIDFGSGPSGPVPADNADQDFPVPADYDGDGTTDLAIFNPATLTWTVRSSRTGTDSTVVMQHNAILPMPVPADVDGVGHAQRVLAGSEGWEIEGHTTLISYGQADGEYPAVADYDGDNHADLSYTADDGLWHTQGSTQTYVVPHPTTDLPLATGRNLQRNIARFAFVGQCTVDPDFCP